MSCKPVMGTLVEALCLDDLRLKQEMLVTYVVDVLSTTYVTNISLL